MAAADKCPPPIWLTAGKRQAIVPLQLMNVVGNFAFKSTSADAPSLTVHVDICPPGYFQCHNGQCFSRHVVVPCDGVRQCPDGSDELECYKIMTHRLGNYEPPNDLSVATTIVLPTIVACVVLVVSMIVGIRKCRQWEIDRIAEMRRKRCAIQMLTAKLKAKNIRRLQAALGLANDDSREPTTTGQCPPPPRYVNNRCNLNEEGNSPPPSYSSFLLNRLFDELSVAKHRSSQRNQLATAKRRKATKNSSLTWV
uniref:Low-density lipoprotein receptor domain class A n=1 Tax=Trichuris muris TaxID=70415 RepID=A0A5S6QZC3_TRIMR